MGVTGPLGYSKITPHVNKATRTGGRKMLMGFRQKPQTPRLETTNEKRTRGFSMASISAMRYARVLRLFRQLDLMAECERRFILRGPQTVEVHKRRSFTVRGTVTWPEAQRVDGCDDATLSLRQDERVRRAKVISTSADVKAMYACDFGPRSVQDRCEGS